MTLIHLPSGHAISVVVEPTNESNDLSPILFIHGIANNRIAYTRLMASLPTRTRIALNLPGHGDSPFYTPLSLASLVDDCLGVLAYAGADGDVDIIGHSGGAVVALALAAELGSRTRALVLLATPGLPMPAKALADNLRAGGIDYSVKVQVEAIGVEGKRNQDIVSAVEKMVLAQGILDGPCAFLESLDGFIPSEKMRMKKAVIVHAVEDPFATREDAEKLAAHIGGEAVIIPDCGHAMLLERPETAHSIIHAALSL